MESISAIRMHDETKTLYCRTIEEGFSFEGMVG